MAKERKAELLDLYGSASKRLFARHKTDGHRITAHRFYRDHEGNDFERGNYVLMTTAPPYKPKKKSKSLFKE